jgi:hypothetical protein
MPRAQHKKLTRTSTVDGVRIFDETGSPVFVITFNIQKFCHKIDEQDENDNVVPVKLRPTEPYLLELNERVFDLIEESIQHAREEGRTNLMVQDVRPSLNGNQKEDDG